MIIYIIVLSIVLIWVFFGKLLLNKKVFLLPVLLLSFFAGSRHYTVGTDSFAYASGYLSNLNPDDYSFRVEVEYGYQVINYIFLKFTHEYFWFFLFTSFIVVLSYLVFIKKYSTNYFLSVFTFITLGFYTFHFNTLRQGIAISLIVVSTFLYINNKKIRSIIFLLLALSFHYSAIIMILFLFLTKIKKIRLEYKITLVFIASVFLSYDIISILAGVNDKYSNYEVLSEKSGGYLTSTFYSIVAIIVYFLGKNLRRNNVNYILLEQIYLYGIALIIPIALLGSDPSGPLRLLYYSNWTLIFILPLLLKRFNSVFIYVFYIIFMLVYFYLTTSSFGGLVPYSINEILI